MSRALTEEEFSNVENILKSCLMLDFSKLSDWEYDFVNSTIDRLEKYKKNTTFSEKQLAILKRIEEKIK